MLLVWGEEDRIVPPGYAAEFADRLERSQTVILPRCGHLPMLERPEEMARQVIEFLGGL